MIRVVLFRLIKGFRDTLAAIVLTLCLITDATNIVTTATTSATANTNTVTTESTNYLVKQHYQTTYFEKPQVSLLTQIPTTHFRCSK
jgi:hypothetical protein